MINRRVFITMCSGIAASFFAMGHSLRNPALESKVKRDFVGPPMPTVAATKPADNKILSATISDRHPDNIIVDNIVAHNSRDALKPRQDIVLEDSEKGPFNALVERLARLQNYVGYGNFNVIGWDQSLRVARSSDQVGAFSQAELDFIEKLFFTNASSFGFYGDKVVTQLSDTIEKRDIVKIPATGHYLFKGIAADTYQKIRRDVGDSIVLTSGIRSVVKQIHLFLGKAAKVNGNLSLASYSLAPPGHSYHALGDFDVGKKGFGRRNFSADFASTDEFKRLSDLGYLDIRYPQNNPYGVRYEPWHIKVV